MSKGQNIRVSDDCHIDLVDHLKNSDRKIGKWTESAIREKIEREKKKSKKVK